MDKLFNDIKKTFKQTVNKVTKKSGKLLEISKITLAISGLKSDIAEEYEKIGKMIYEGYKNDSVPSQDVTAHCELIDAKLGEIEKHQMKLSQIKEKKICAACNAEVSVDSTFCANCGEKL